MSETYKKRMFVCEQSEYKPLEDWLKERFGEHGKRWTVRMVKTWKDDPVVVELWLRNDNDVLAFDIAWYGKIVSIGNWTDL